MVTSARLVQPCDGARSAGVTMKSASDKVDEALHDVVKPSATAAISTLAQSPIRKARLKSRTIRSLHKAAIAIAAVRRRSGSERRRRAA